MAIYTGLGLSNLRLIARTDPLLIDVLFQSTAGETYQIVLDGDADENPVNLQLSVDYPPGNDDLTFAKVVRGASAVLSGNTVGATREPGEPPIGALPFGHSLWFA